MRCCVYNLYMVVWHYYSHNCVHMISISLSCLFHSLNLYIHACVRVHGVSYVKAMHGTTGSGNMAKANKMESMCWLANDFVWLWMPVRHTNTLYYSIGRHTHTHTLTRTQTRTHSHTAYITHYTCQFIRLSGLISNERSHIMSWCRNFNTHQSRPKKKQMANWFGMIGKAFFDVVRSVEIFWLELLWYIFFWNLE